MKKQFILMSLIWLASSWLISTYAQSITDTPQAFPKGKVEVSSTHRAGNGPKSWVRRGPYNVGGRTRAVAIDRTNENVILAGGAAEGGVWRSNDGGNSWVKTTLPSQSYSVTCIVQDPRPGFSNIWYFGTGEMENGDPRPIYRGRGIYKSIDGGNNWAVLPNTQEVNINEDFFRGAGDIPRPLEFVFIWNLAIDPRNGHLYAATYSGIMRSTDGGASWIKVLVRLRGTPPSGTISLGWTDIAITKTGMLHAVTYKPSTPQTTQADEGIFTSSDGQTWTNVWDQAKKAFTPVLNGYLVP